MKVIAKILRGFAGRRSALLAVMGMMSLAAVLLPLISYAQVSTATLNGTIQDSTGAVVPGATVSVIQTATNFKTERQSQADGSFSIPSLPVGPYLVRVIKSGFKTYDQTGIILTVGQVATLQVSLAVGSTTQTVVVTAEVPTVDSTESTIQSVVAEKTISDIPLNGRNPAALMYTVPGVTNAASNPNSTNGNSTILSAAIYSTIGAATESSPTVNGVRPGGTYFSLDGASNVDPFLVIGGPFPDPDATQEFSVVTGTYGARYVSAPGGAVNIVTKSGTNKIHGDAFEFIRNGYFNATNYFSTIPDTLKRNQFGGVAGGPLLKDKLFIFGSFQETLLRAPNLIGNFVGIDTPVEDMEKGQFCKLNAQGACSGTIVTMPQDPVMVKLEAYVPPPNYSLGGVYGYYNTTLPDAINDPQYVGRIDYHMGSHQLFFRYFGDHSTQAVDPMQRTSLTSSGYNVLTSVGGSRNIWDTGSVGDTWTSKSGAWVVDGRASLLKADQVTLADPSLANLSTTDLGIAASPGLAPTVPLIYGLGSFLAGSQEPGHSMRYSWDYSDNVLHVSTKHQISFGTDIQYMGIDFSSLFPQAPQFVFLGVLAPAIFGQLDNNGYADMWLGHPGEFEQGDGSYQSYTDKLIGLYAQDRYRATERLTVTGGLRWDPFLPYLAAANHMECWNPGQQSTVFPNAPEGLIFPGDPNCENGGTTSKYDIVEPRLGVAYRLDQKGDTAIRAGWGMYSTQFPVISLSGFGGVPFDRNFIFYDYLTGFQQTMDEPWTSLNTTNPFATGYLNASYVPPSNISFTQSEQLGFSTSAITRNFRPAYVEQWTLSLQHQLDRADSIELDYAGTLGVHESQSYDANLPVYNPTTKTATRPYASEGLDQILTLISNSTSNYNGLNVTFTHRNQGGLDLVSAFNWSKCLDDGSQPPALQGAFNGTEEADNLVANGALLPRNRYGRCDFDQNLSFRNTVVWNLPDLNGHGRLLRAVAGSWILSGLVAANAGQPFSVKDSAGNSETGLGLDLANIVPGVSPYLHGKLNYAAFTANPLGTYGNSARNGFRNPTYYHVDPGLMKTFPLGNGRVHLMFRAEAFNVFNHPTFETGFFDYNTPYNFGVYSVAHNPRQLQFAGKILF